jgi:hypothetical protein
MGDPLGRLIFITILLAGGISYNIYIFRHTEVIDRPMDGWYGKALNRWFERIGKRSLTNKSNRLKIYRIQIFLNIMPLSFLLFLWVWTLAQWIKSE